MLDTSAIAGIVLAGGRSSRMDGENKALLQLAGETLLTRAIQRLRLQVKALAINSNVPIPGNGYPVIADTVTGYAGPLAGILTGMVWARDQGLSHIVTVACDTPFFSTDLVDRLGSAPGGSGRIALAASAGRLHPVFGLWPVHLAEDLSNYLESNARHSVLTFAERHGFETVAFDFGAVDPFFNINTRQDLAEAERLAQKA
ncbi:MULTISPECIES: molybdenum cofactor guanylyltransferase MobA [Mesorhizobium]|uniref:Molybdenum cofactor guanylyltransferase n=1 Tax=Mesorhizobium denitrificans TaxID=2294114 RepID=A0A371XDB9_9HYPH|nr:MULTISPECIES: molybdenum cofactor guanylyltransferase MobA [Mesorhizobium]RFC67216.1 molybdenum cofactor guanylyltransferase MobA [Mesorhizobium denitrificans]